MSEFWKLYEAKKVHTSLSSRRAMTTAQGRGHGQGNGLTFNKVFNSRLTAAIVPRNTPRS